MRDRLLRAVRALLDDPRVSGQKINVQAAAVVLTAKTRQRHCRVLITAKELGRWLGVSESTIDHEVVPALRKAGIVEWRVDKQDGQLVGVEYRVMPLWENRDVTKSPLALSQPEFATLLRFVEGLFAPGWGPKSSASAGLLAARRRHGAAADRLGLLLLALHARSDGRVPLVGGRLKKEALPHGRAAVTLKQMLGCELPEAASMLGRLRRWSVVAPAGDREQLIVPAIAAAHRSARADVAGKPVSAAVEEAPQSGGGVGCALCGVSDDEQLPLEGDGWRQESFEDLLGAEGDRETAPGVSGPLDLGKSAGQSRFSDESGNSQTAGLHTNHPRVADVMNEGAGVIGFSGAAVGGEGGLPGRAGTREDVSAEVSSACAASSGSGGPLRGENPDSSGLLSGGGVSAAQSALLGWRAVTGGPPPVWAQLPEGLVEVLRPVELVWGRLSRRGARRRVEKAVRAELHRLRSLLGEQADVEGVLRRRLALRVQEQGSVPVTDPVGWLIGRALPQRQHCPERRCDDGRLMHNGADCEACRWLVGDRRALRISVAQRLADTLGLPDSTALLAPDAPADLRTCLESKLRQECRELAQKRAAAVQEHAQLQDQLRKAAERRRREDAARAKEQELLPCEDCGQARSGGLCPGCRATRQTEDRIREAVDLALAVFGHQHQPRVQADATVATATEAGMRSWVEQTIAACRTEGGFASVAAQRGLLEAELELERLRRVALDYLESTGEAHVEGRQAFEAEMRRAPMYGSYQAARQGALEAEGQAKRRVAEHLLQDRLRSYQAELQRQRQVAEPPDPYALKASEARALLCRPRPGLDEVATKEGLQEPGRGSRRLASSGAPSVRPVTAGACA